MIVTALDSSVIDAQVAAVAASVAVGGTTGVGVAIGVSLAENEIDAGGGSGSGALTASIGSSSIKSDGAVEVQAYSTQTIDADTLAGAVAISGGGTTGVAVAGAGVAVSNLITLAITADITGDGTQTITAGRVAVDAYDQSWINATDGAAAVSASFGGEAGVAVSVGLSLAQNTINDPVSAYISGVSALNAALDTAEDHTLKAGDIVNLASGSYQYKGLTATLNLNAQTYTNTALWTQIGFITTGTKGSASQNATIAAGDTVTIGSGYNAATYQTSQGTITSLATNATVQNAKGVVYQYIGPTIAPAGGVDLTTEDFTDTTMWRRLASAGDVYTYIRRKRFDQSEQSELFERAAMAARQQQPFKAALRMRRLKARRRNSGRLSLATRSRFPAPM